MIKNVETGINEIDKEGKVDVISLKEEEIKGENKTTSVDLRSKEFLEKTSFIEKRLRLKR